MTSRRSFLTAAAAGTLAGGSTYAAQVASPAMAMFATLVEATAFGSRMKSEPQPRS